MSVLDHTAPNSLLPTQLELEAGVGIEPTHRSFAVRRSLFLQFSDPFNFSAQRLFSQEIVSVVNNAEMG